jgi:subfamily B ATP-binding cassette protein MsbA
MYATKALSVSVIQILAAGSMAVILFLMSQSIMIDSISAGSFASLLTAMMLMLRPLKQLANVNSDFQ